jgi:hypothetical protein
MRGNWFEGLTQRVRECLVSGYLPGLTSKEIFLPRLLKQAMEM